MITIGAFDVIGPNMIGPSSSHTAGAASMALLAKKLFQKKIAKVSFVLYGSFAKTYKGHGTDKALLAGIMGFKTDDERIIDAFSIADREGLIYDFVVDEETRTKHPNTVDMCMDDGCGTAMKVTGVSTGGGKIKITNINGVAVEFTGEYPTIIVKQKDTPGIVAHITQCLSNHNVNIAFMSMYRESKGNNAYTIVESDEIIPQNIIDEIKNNTQIQDTILIQA